MKGGCFESRAVISSCSWVILNAAWGCSGLRNGRTQRGEPAKWEGSPGLPARCDSAECFGAGGAWSPNASSRMGRVSWTDTWTDTHFGEASRSPGNHSGCSWNKILWLIYLINVFGVSTAFNIIYLYKNAYELRQIFMWRQPKIASLANLKVRKW